MVQKPFRKCAGRKQTYRRKILYFNFIVISRPYFHLAPDSWRDLMRSLLHSLLVSFSFEDESFARAWNVHMCSNLVSRRHKITASELVIMSGNKTNEKYVSTECVANKFNYALIGKYEHQQHTSSIKYPYDHCMVGGDSVIQLTLLEWSLKTAVQYNFIGSSSQLLIPLWPNTMPISQ